MNWAPIDIVFALLVLFCVVHASIRGFISEFFSKAAVILAALTGVLFYKMLMPYIEDVLGITVFIDIISFLSIFIVVYLLVKIIQKILAMVFDNDILSGLDKALGFFLGLLEGILIVAVVLIILYAQPFFSIEKLLSSSIFNELLSPFLNEPVHAVSEWVNSL